MSDAHDLVPQAESRAPQSGAVPEGTVTIFFSDIREFTRQTEDFGDEAAYEVLRVHNAIVTRCLEEAGGRVVKTQGDSFMVEFKSARRAILAAVAIQQALAEANEREAGPPINVGIGISTGEPIQEGGDFFGSTVNLAARICAAAGAGQILVADTTRYVAGKIDSVDYVNRRFVELKGFPERQPLSEIRWRQQTSEGTTAGDEELAALKSAVQKAIGILNRVLAVTHLDDPAFAPLLECQKTASDLRLLLSRATSEPRPPTAPQVSEMVRPFENLLTLVVEGAGLTEERWAQLDSAVTKVFGRALVTSAARRRLSAGGAAPASSTPPPRPEPAPELRKPVPPPTTGAAPRVPVVPAVAPPPPLDPRAADVRWWAAAYTAWSQWKLSGISWAHALRGELGKYPYLLSVPIQESADYDNGQLAGGYFMLLEHVEVQSPHFLTVAVERALQGTQGEVTSETLGPRIYRALVDGGRLRETYAALVREVVGVAIPHPGVWADGGMVEYEDSSVAITRPGGTGDTREQPFQITDTAERMADHFFTVELQPLTSRFFFVKPADFKSPRDVKFKLTVDGEPSDLAWYVTLRTSLVVRAEPRALPREGIALPGMGKDHAGAWLALYNPDPFAAATYELSISVRPPAVTGPRWAPHAPPGPR